MAKSEKTSNLPIVDDWLETDNLILLEGWARDGYTVDDIAFKIGISTSTLLRWMRNNEEIKKAINDGRELVDYKVENALLKAALGYKTREVKVTTVVRGGKVVENIKEVTTSAAAPNVQAAKVWLYNRQPKKWKPESVRSQSILDKMDDDTDIKITIERAGTREQEQGEIMTKPSSDGQEVDEEWQDEINQSITIRKATPQEKQKAKEEKRRKKEEQSGKTKIVKEEQDEVQHISNNVHTSHNDTSNDVNDIDYWPDDWTDDEEWSDDQ